MISAAICWASAALPPLPISRILLPERSAAMIDGGDRARGREQRHIAVRAFKRGERLFQMGSDRIFRSWIWTLAQKHRPCCKLVSLVMIAAGRRKRAHLATLMRNAVLRPRPPRAVPAQPPLSVECPATRTGRAIFRKNNPALRGSDRSCGRCHHQMGAGPVCVPPTAGFRRAAAICWRRVARWLGGKSRTIPARKGVQDD